MWSALPQPWQACLEEAWAAYCAGTFPIGAALVDGSGRILARGRNEIHDRDGEAQLIRNRELAHAELRTLFAVERDRIDSNCTLYSLLEPCPLCIGALYMSGVRKLCFAARDPLAGSTNLIGSTPYMSRKPIRIAQSEVKGLEGLVVAIYVDFDLGFRGADAYRALDPWRDAYPGVFALGEALFGSSRLRALRSAGAAACEVVDELAPLIEPD